MANKAVHPDRYHRETPGFAQRRFQSQLDKAGIQVNGNRRWDIQVHNPKTYGRVIRHGSLGLGEAYVDGWWDCQRLDEFFTRVLKAGLDNSSVVYRWFKTLHTALVNRQSIRRAFKVGEIHYDVGNDLYQRMLDPTLSYSCGYWSNAADLDSAQQNKLDLICRKLHLKPGMKLLDIGCGWGGLAAFAARHYQVEVEGITISVEQKKLAEERVAGLPVTIKLVDYRSLEGKYDRIVSVGMFEHVGPKNYRTYFAKANELLREDGLFLLQTIGEELTTHITDPFINKYIFPNGKVASRKHLSDATLDLFRLEDWHNFGPDYDRTLMAWAGNFERYWDEIKDNYSEQFYRMWRYYLNCCAGFFRSRKGQLWQLVLAHPDRIASYKHER